MDLNNISDLIRNSFVDFNFLTLIVVLVIILLYLFFCYILNSMNRMLYGKDDWLSWVPIGNTYLIGKLNLNSLVGSILLGAFILVILLNLFVMSNTFVMLLSIMYFILLLIAVAYTVYRYFDLRKISKSNDDLTGNTLDLGNQDISPVTSNGPSDITINNVSVIPTNDITNINSVSTNNNVETKTYVMPEAILKSNSDGLDAFNNIKPINENEKEENIVTNDNNVDNLDNLNVKPIITQNENSNLSNENIILPNNQDNLNLSQDAKMDIDSLLDINRKI